MNVPQTQRNAWIGLAATSGTHSEAVRHLRDTLPPDARIVSTSDHSNNAQVIAEVLRSGEPCVLGCSDAESHATLVVLVTTLRSLGSIRHAAILNAHATPSTTDHTRGTIPTLNADQARSLIAQLANTPPALNAPLSIATEARHATLLHAAGGSFPW